MFWNWEKLDPPDEFLLNHTICMRVRRHKKTHKWQIQFGSLILGHSPYWEDSRKEESTFLEDWYNASN